MPDARRHSIATSQLRLASLVLVLGAFATGVLLLGKLTEILQADIFRFYGVVPDTVGMVHAGDLSLTLGQIAVMVIAFVGTIGFVAIETRRLRGLQRIRCACARPTRMARVTRLTIRQRFETFILRSSLSASILLTYWVLQTSWQRYDAGLGWGLQVDGIATILPLASVFGLCVIVGMFVALISMHGLRMISQLELLAGAIVRRTRTRFVYGYTMAANTTRTLRERFGDELLSRPPPLVRA